jgi:ferredoxin--NADP+ reductase
MSSPTAADPVLTTVKMHLHTPAAPGVGVVVANDRCTASKKAAGFVRHVSIDVSGTGLAGNFVAGQSFGVVPPGVDDRGVAHKLRLYSIASPTSGEDGKGHVLATTVKRLIDEHQDTGKLFLGVASNYLCDLKPGDKVTVTGPNGKRFVLPADPAAHDYLFFATGTGIAPFRGMVRDLLSAGVQSRVTLVMGSPYASDLLYDQDLRSLAENHPNFRYLTALSRERQPDGGPAIYVQDRLRTHREELGDLLGSSRTLVYVCGIAGMELGIFRAIAGELPAEVCEQYLTIDGSVRSTPAAWDRRMLHKQISPSRRVFLEVY